MNWIRRLNRKHNQLRGGRNLGLHLSRRLLHVLGVPRERHIVICGYPRSGTSLLYNMVTATIEGYDFDDFENVCLNYIARSGNVVSKRPLDVFNLPPLAERNVRDKELVVLVTVRDLRDVLTSRHPRVADRYFIGYDSCTRVDDDGRRFDPSWDNPGIGAIANAIARLDTLPGLHVVPVRYEALVTTPDVVQRELGNALGLTFSGPFSGFHAKGKDLAYRYDRKGWEVDPSLVREDGPVDASRAGKWRREEHRERIANEFGRHPELFGLLRRYGYETDDAWFEPYAPST